MKTLTDKQKESVKILVRLGDSLELAIKTVKNHAPKNTQKKHDLYVRAYES